MYSIHRAELYFFEFSVWCLRHGIENRKRGEKPNPTRFFVIIGQNDELTKKPNATFCSSAIFGEKTCAVIG